ncbi:MAG: penicillin-binding transpeptidase domain-containing protein, partial [Ilumatobacteraceae bacterium]
VDAGQRRWSWVGSIALALLTLLWARVWFLQAVTKEETDRVIAKVQSRTVKLVPERGRIFDVNGRVVADNKRVLVAAIDRRIIEDPQDRLELFLRLSGPLNTPLERLYERADDKRYDEFTEMPLAFDISEEQAAFIMERIEDYPGVVVKEDWRRIYPYGAVGGHVLGYLGAIQKDSAAYYKSLGYDPNERVGLYGVELTYEVQLRGIPGFVRYEVDAVGRIKRVLERVEPQPGNDLQLSIDFKMQQFAEQALETQLLVRQRNEAPQVMLPEGIPDPQYEEVNYYKAPAGSVVVMNHNSGEVVAMASYPRFDARWFTANVNAEKFAQVFPRTDDPDRSILVNRAVSGRYNLGSSFKPFVAYAALNSGQLPGGAEYELDDRGSYKLVSIPKDRCDQGVKCVFRNAICRATGAPCRYGEVDIEAALAVSSDVFFYKIGEEILTERGYQPVLESEIRRFGFGSLTNIDLPYEFAGTIPNAAYKKYLASLGVIAEDAGRAYYVGDNILFSIGQGLLSATPLQVANAYAALANGGTVFQPRVVRAILTPGTKNKSAGLADLQAASVVERVSAAAPREEIPMRPEVRDPIVSGLRRVITGPGVNFDYYHKTTGENLFRNYTGMPIAGKTGTAQGFNNLPWNDSSAFGAFSLDATRPYSAFAYLEKSGYGAVAAAPVVKCVFLALSKQWRVDDLVPADPLDTASNIAAASTRLRNPLCLVSTALDARD